MFKPHSHRQPGEIALRIIRTCKRLNIETVVVYSQADKDALYLKLADKAICIGPPPARESYLKINNIIAAAEIADVEAIHPGYGFLAENAHFAEVCRACKIAFIGPPTQAMEATWATRSRRGRSPRRPACPSSPVPKAPSRTWRPR